MEDLKKINKLLGLSGRFQFPWLNDKLHSRLRENQYSATVTKYKDKTELWEWSVTVEIDHIQREEGGWRLDREDAKTACEDYIRKTFPRSYKRKQ